MAKKHRNQKKNRKKGLSPGTLVYTGDREIAPANILLTHFSEQSFKTSSEYNLSERDKMLWLDIRGLTDTALIERVGLDFQIHPLALEDVLNTGQRSKLEEYDNCLFFVLPNLKLNVESSELEPEQIALFAGENFVISFQEDPDDTLEAVRLRLQEGLGRGRKKGADYLLYTLIDNVVDGYFIIMDNLESTVLDLEETMHLRGAENGTKAKIFQLKHLANELKHRILPLREATSRFQRSESSLIDNSNRFFFRDLQDHVNQILDSLDNQRDMLANLEALYHAEAASRMNNVMHLLTVISTIFIPLSFIVGLYGMNFDNMPELHHPNGYFILLGAMSLMLLGMLGYFKAKKWL